MPNDIDQSIYATVRYFDIFAMPVTATQIWQSLVIPQGPRHVRWGGHRHYTLREIQHALASSQWLAERLDMKWGIWTLKGKTHLIRERLTRHARAQQKWKIVRRAARVLAAVPFVRALAGSGSLALDHTREGSDLDLFIIARKGRIWTARLGLLVTTQLLGLRRKYWNVEAPDKLCLNHYIASDALVMSPDVRNLYTAVQYTLHVPVFGVGVLRQFRQENARWIREYVMSPDLPSARHRYTVALAPALRTLKQMVENLLLEPIGDGIEHLAERLQRSAMERHEQIGRQGPVQSQSGYTGQSHVVISNQELAFHPDTKVPAILAAYEQDPNQKVLL